MTQMSSKKAAQTAPVARRLRFARGDETQAAFSKRVGVSRSALANYETGRSRPDDFALSRIAERLGLDPDFFLASHETAATETWSGTVGLAIEGRPDWTDDEALVVRILRLCDQETIRRVLGEIAESALAAELVITLGQIYEVHQDVNRISELAAGKQLYEKGPLSFYPTDSPLHAIGFKRKANP